MPTPKIIYTLTDEAPALATASLLPIVQRFAQAAEIAVETRNISLAARILAAFDLAPDDLAELGASVSDPTANIIKLPNISASLPQLKAAITELQSQGFDLPEYEVATATYDRVKGSAVNPVLRQGNSDRRAPAAVKAYAKAHPHRMGAWAPDSPANVATMDSGDFAHNEASVVCQEDRLAIRLVTGDGEARLLKANIAVGDGDVVDASYLSAQALDSFLAAQVQRARKQGLLFSAHLKATMMKVSDPIIFGHVVRAVLPQVFEQYDDDLRAAGISANDGLASILAACDTLENGEAIRAAVVRGLESAPPLAMVDSDRGITSLHVPSDVIIDASMPAMIRAGGKMWGPDGVEHDTLAVIPDSSYAGVYQAVIDDCRLHGALDPANIGTVPNVGLMANAAEEYGSHPFTFLIETAGRVEVVSETTGEVLISHEVEAGDIWRMCRTKDAAIQDWVALAVRRARLSNMPIVFWLNGRRPHDYLLLSKLEQTLPSLDTDGLDIHVMPPPEACAFALARMRAGLDTIAVTGNVLRDYLTDLFPILEVGTSAKMLSIVPLMAGGGLFETGAGGSAPKHVQQLVRQNYLRWDSLGEFFALAASFEHFAQAIGNLRATVLAQTLDAATGRFLEEDRSPGRRLGSIDNRGSHFYLALYWAEALAAQTDDAGLAATFTRLAKRLAADESKIVDELLAVQGQPVEIGGYYRPDPALVTAVMRPSPTFNAALNSLGA